MKNSARLQRYYAASMLGGLCALRIGTLVGVGMLSTLRKTINHYPSCFQSSELVDWSRPDEQFGHCLDTVSRCIETSWQDYRNGLQIFMLTQDEMQIWAAKIGKTLAVD